MSVIVCPGIHTVELTVSFLEALRSQLAGNIDDRNKTENILIFPSQDYPAYSAIHILQFLEHSGVKIGDREQLPDPLVFISFSAGVVGAIGAAWAWRFWGGNVKAFIAIDGWGVPLTGDFPIHRISHDFFTHSSSAWLGSPEDSFYADPPVSHLEIWRSPATAVGWWVKSESDRSDRRKLTNAAWFLTMLLERYQGIGNRE